MRLLLLFVLLLAASALSCELRGTWASPESFVAPPNVKVVNQLLDFRPSYYALLITYVVESIPNPKIFDTASRRRGRVLVFAMLSLDMYHFRFTHYMSSLPLSAVQTLFFVAADGEVFLQP
jgi:hypothetical protein